MKKFTLLYLLLLITGVTQAQTISGKAYYQSKTTVNPDDFGRKMDEGMKQMIMERMKKMLEKTYILTFTNDESIYKEEEVLETGGSGRGMAMMMGSFTPGVQYKNVKKNELIEEREFFGKQFLIVDSIPKLNWKLEKESKQIGQYIAFKATALKPVDSSDLSMMRRRRPEPDQEKKKDSIQKEEDPINQIEVPKEILVTAWYTPQIPVSNGPGEYAGLPGLILELNVYRTTILCNKIVLNPKEVEEIKPPNKGKKVTRKEYNKIIGEKMKEMRENFRGRRGGRPMGGL